MKKREIIAILTEEVAVNEFALLASFNHSGEVHDAGVVTHYNPEQDEFTVRWDDNSGDEQIFFVKSKDILGLEVDG